MIVGGGPIHAPRRESISTVLQINTIPSVSPTLREKLVEIGRWLERGLEQSLSWSFTEITNQKLQDRKVQKNQILNE